MVYALQSLFLLFIRIVFVCLVFHLSKTNANTNTRTDSAFISVNIDFLNRSITTKLLVHSMIKSESNLN